MSRILVTPEELIGAAGEFLNGSQQTDQLITQLSGIVDGLSSSWEGLAQSSFFQRFEELKPALQEFVTITEGINEQLKSVAKEMEDTDSRLASALKG